MSDINSQFTSAYLREARKDAREQKVEIPKGLTTWRHNMGNNPYYEVWADGSVVWQGSAYDANEAKAKYIDGLIPS